MHRKKNKGKDIELNEKEILTQEKGKNDENISNENQLILQQNNYINKTFISLAQKSNAVPSLENLSTINHQHSSPLTEVLRNRIPNMLDEDLFKEIPTEGKKSNENTLLMNK